MTRFEQLEQMLAEHGGMLQTAQVIPQYKTGVFSHFEEIQLYVNNISKDRISDFACNFLKSFLIDFTQDECKKYTLCGD